MHLSNCFNLGKDKLYQKLFDPMLKYVSWVHQFLIFGVYFQMVGHSCCQGIVKYLSIHAKTDMVVDHLR